MPREHHTPSGICQRLCVAFVLGVSDIIDDQLSPTRYGEFYKQCELDKYPVGDVPRKIIENKMLCVLMCCCNKFPGAGTSKNVFQGCVKDILDEVNEVRRGRRKLPTSRFLAEPSINMQLNEVGRGQMNPGGPPKRSGQALKRPDVGILKQTPMTPSAGPGTITMDDFERFVEMKFPTESQDAEKHADQIRDYLKWGKNVTFMTTQYRSQNMLDSKFSYWGCDCDRMEEQKLLEPGDTSSVAEILEGRKARMMNALDAITIVFPWGKILSPLKGIGSVKRLLSAGI